MWIKNEESGEYHWIDSSNYFATARLNEYFGDGFIRPFRMPQSSTEKVEIEPLSSPYLPDLDPTEPILGTFTSRNGRELPCQMVVGYREIYQKRERIQQLKDAERGYKIPASENCHKNFLRDLAPGGGKLLCKKKKGRKGKGCCSWRRKKRPSHRKDGACPCFGSRKHRSKRKGGGTNPALSNTGAANPTQETRRRTSNFSLVPLTADKCEREQDFHEPKPDFTEVTVIEKVRQGAIDRGKTIVRQLSLGSHYMVLQHQGDQLDTEWLQLSASTDVEEEIEKVRRKRLRPAHENWMDTGIGYASQKMFRSLRFFFWMLMLTFRNPFVIQPCYRNKIMMLHIFRKRMMIFSFSTLLLWTFFCFVTINVIDLKYRTEEDDLYQNVEFEELNLFFIPILSFYINLFLASFWSLLVLLHYCLVIANYYNLWSKAMPFLEMNPNFGLSTYVNWHMRCFLVYLIIMAFSFHRNWPVVTRETCGQIFVLIFRHMFPQVRLLDPDKFYWGQLGGFILYMYCVWVNRTLFMFLHTFAIMLQNASFQWNLNFAIRFQLIVTYYRAHLLRVATQSNLIRLYNQHRLIVGLCNYYGKVFLHPLCIYMVTNMGVVTLIMIYFIKYQEVDPHTYGNNYFYEWEDGKTKAVIYYVLPKQHELTAVAFVLLQCIVDFIQGTIGIAWGSGAIQMSFEFVRRHGLIQCNSQHERRLIHSLYISFSEPRSPVITADRYFTITKGNVFTGIMTMAFFWTMIIQCQVEQPSALIEWVNNDTGRCKNLPLREDVRGGHYCMKGQKHRQTIKNRMKRNRMDKISKLKVDVDSNVNFWMFDDCFRDEFTTVFTAKRQKESHGLCRVISQGSPEDAAEMKEKFPRYINQDWFNAYTKYWNQSIQEWKRPTYSDSDEHPCLSKGSQFNWKEYQRDFFRSCTSKKYNSSIFVLPLLFDKKKPHRPKVVWSRLDWDCGVNPYIKQEVGDVVACDGQAVYLDDCGSPNVPAFVLRNDEQHIFKRPSLRYFSYPIPNFPEMYRAAGIPTSGIVRCWETLTALEKCMNPDYRRYCKLSHALGFLHMEGYLYGKDCYTFINFGVFVQPNKFLFCRHPRPKEPFGGESPNQWITEEEFEGLRENGWVSPEDYAKIVEEDQGKLVNNRVVDQASSGNPHRKRRNAPSPRPNPPDTSSSSSSSSQQSHPRRLKRASNPIAKYRKGNEIPRSEIFTKYFPCVNDKGKDKEAIVGWLHIPQVKMREEADEDPINDRLFTRYQRDYTAGTLKGCWTRPYKLDVLKAEAGGKFSDINEVVDGHGRQFLDDCLNTWWEPSEFIPDLVFNPTEENLVERNGHLCWDNPSALANCPVDEAGEVCFKPGQLEYDGDLFL